MLTTAIPVTFFASPGDGFRFPPSRLGEHTRVLLAELGFSEAEIDQIAAPGLAPAARQSCPVQISVQF